MILDAYNLDRVSQWISLNTQIVDSDGKNRFFAVVDTMKKTGTEQIFPDINSPKLSYEIVWDDKNPFPYDIFIFGLKNPTDEEIEKLIGDKNGKT